MIEYCILFYAETRIDTPWKLIENSDDIFMSSDGNKIIGKELIRKISNMDHIDYQDWFSHTVLE